MSRDRIRDMKRAMCSLAIVLAAALTVDLGAQRRNAAGAGAAVDVDTALKTVVPDLDKRLARFKVVRMPFAGASVTLRERRMIDELVEACRFLESMFWRQSDPDGLALYKALAGHTSPLARGVRRY